MGEAKRKRTRQEKSRNELTENLLRLHAEMNGKICFEVTIQRPADAMAAFLRGADPSCLRDFDVVAQFFGLLKSGKRPLCLACEHEFHLDGVPPLAFTQCTPVQSKPSGRMIVGICPKCSQMPDEKLLEISAGRMRQLGLAPVASGTA